MDVCTSAARGGQGCILCRDVCLTKTELCFSTLLCITTYRCYLSLLPRLQSREGRHRTPTTALAFGPTSHNQCHRVPPNSRQQGASLPCKDAVRRKRGQVFKEQHSHPYSQALLFPNTQVLSCTDPPQEPKLHRQAPNPSCPFFLPRRIHLTPRHAPIHLPESQAECFKVSSGEESDPAHSLQLY